jgi:hypothetical protein
MNGFQALHELLQSEARAESIQPTMSRRYRHPREISQKAAGLPTHRSMSRHRPLTPTVHELQVCARHS